MILRFRKHKNVPLHIVCSLLIIILTLLLATVSFLCKFLYKDPMAFLFQSLNHLFADFVRNYPICETEECLQIGKFFKLLYLDILFIPSNFSTAASIKASMNSSADPCDDFYK